MLREAFDTAVLFTRKSVTDQHRQHQMNETDAENPWLLQRASLELVVHAALGDTLKRARHTNLYSNTVQFRLLTAFSNVSSHASMRIN